MFLEHQQPKPRRIWPYVIVSALLLIVGIGAYAVYYVFHLTPQQLINNPLVQHYVPDNQKDLLERMPELLGYNGSKTYLLLLENNTELRPGGGFIGVYAVVQMTSGTPHVLVLEGTELLDGRAPKTWKVAPPKPLTEQLGVDRWYFRDSNWSPDFAESAKQSLAFYAAEGGTGADSIDAVVAITPTVLEELMKITGPFTISGITFSADTVTQTLEYEVEYGYRERGLAKEDRKAIIEPFMDALLSHIKDTAFTHYDEYFDLGKRMAAERHILAYAPEESLQQLFSGINTAGRVQSTNGDYLLWVDANLAALKTDHAMKRSLNYRIEKTNVGKYIATAEMTYVHGGVFDWRTTRYRTYARVFVPSESKLVETKGSMKKDRSKEPGVVDQGSELGKQWFGTFIAIEPGETKTLVFKYELPESVVKQINDRAYTLFVQKQLGTITHGLTLDLNFGTTITAADPAEEQKEWGNASYRIQTDLRIDREFKVNF